MSVADRVLHRYRLRQAGFVLAERAETAPSPAILAKSRALVAELRELATVLGPPQRGLIERTVKKYDSSLSPSTGFERDFQFQLLLAIKELEKPSPNNARISSILKELDEIFTQMG